MHDHRTTDTYDATQDARSEERYDDDPRAEPTLDEVKERGYFACSVDESAGLREERTTP